MLIYFFCFWGAFFCSIFVVVRGSLIPSPNQTSVLFNPSAARAGIRAEEACRLAFLSLIKYCFAHSLADRKASDPGSFRPCLFPCSILQEPRQRAGGGIEVSSNHSSRISFVGPHLCPAQTHSGADSRRYLPANRVRSVSNVSVRVIEGKCVPQSLHLILCWTCWTHLYERCRGQVLLFHVQLTQGSYGTKRSSA